MFDDLADLTDSPASYLAVLALVALDAVFPLAPSETVLVTGGVLIERGDLIAPLFVLAAACGAVLGDSILFGLGSRTGPGLRAKLFSSERARERLRVAERVIHERTWLLIVSDFVPGGRTAAMFAAGALGLPPARFYGFIVPGALLWAILYTLLGIAGGSLFEEGWGALAASIGVAVAIGVAAEAIYRFRRRSPRSR
jgi:membrane-associated protein